MSSRKEGGPGAKRARVQAPPATNRDLLQKANEDNKKLSEEKARLKAELQQKDEIIAQQQDEIAGLRKQMDKFLNSFQVKEYDVVTIEHAAQQMLEALKPFMVFVPTENRDPSPEGFDPSPEACDQSSEARDQSPEGRDPSPECRELSPERRTPPPVRRSPSEVRHELAPVIDGDNEVEGGLVAVNQDGHSEMLDLEPQQQLVPSKTQKVLRWLPVFERGVSDEPSTRIDVDYYTESNRLKALYGLLQTNQFLYDPRDAASLPQRVELVPHGSALEVFLKPKVGKRESNDEKERRLERIRIQLVDEQLKQRSANVVALVRREVARDLSRDPVAVAARMEIGRNLQE